MPLRPEQSLQIRNLAIVVEGEPRFTHIDTRSKAPVIAGMIFGVLGDAAVSAHKEAGYQRTADSMAPSAGEFSCRQMFARGLLETLQKAGRFRSVELVAEHSEAKVAKGFDTLAVFQIQRWGSRVQDTGADKLMLFVEVHTTMTRLGENRAIWTDTQVLAREARHTIEEYQQRNELMKTDIAEVVTNAGQRMATLLLSR